MLVNLRRRFAITLYAVCGSLARSLRALCQLLPLLCFTTNICFPISSHISMSLCTSLFELSCCVIRSLYLSIMRRALVDPRWLRSVSRLSDD